MNKKELYNLLEKLCEKSSKERIKEFLFSVIEELSDDQNKEIIELINEVFKDETIKEIEEQFDLINDGELQFHSETYETGNYNYWDDDYETSYYDPENVSNIILNAYNLASILITKKDYKNAKKILD